MKKLIFAVFVLLTFTGAAQSIKGYRTGVYRSHDLNLLTTFAGFNGYLQTSHINSGKVYSVSFHGEDLIDVDDAKELIKLIDAKYNISLKPGDDDPDDMVTLSAVRGNHIFVLIFKERGSEHVTFVFGFTDITLFHIHQREEKDKKLKDM